MILRHILYYLIAHPNAKDTIEGILRWWLPGGIVVWEEGAVQDALDLLAARGWVTRRLTTSSHALYGLNEEQLAEVRAFLDEHQ